MKIYTTIGQDTPLSVASIAPGATFEHNGPVIVTGDIGAGATVNVSGMLRVAGSVGDNAKIMVEGDEGLTIKSVGTGAKAQGNNGVSVGPRGVHIGGNHTGPINTGVITSVNTEGRAYVAGRINVGHGIYVAGDLHTNGRDFVGRKRSQDAFAANAAPGLSAPGILIEGEIGNNVELVAVTGDIDINKAGTFLKAHACGTFKAGTLGDSAWIMAGRDLSFATAGQDGTYNADNDLNAGKTGARSVIGAGANILVIAALGEHSSVTAGHSIRAGDVAQGCTLFAGTDITVQRAHDSVTFYAGNSTIIGTTYGRQKVHPAGHKPGL